MTARSSPDPGAGRSAPEPVPLWIRAAVLPIRLYQRCLSPLLPATCRFHPTCSAYGVEALRVHGLGRGMLLLVWRILRCQPFSRGGYDPVPPRRC